ncbi:MAG: nitric oxide reductase activation protein [Gammaproteobacteria bacterium]|nr:nitric oxide reductase activation protein [Gammaproteobacteria bacterium]
MDGARQNLFNLIRVQKDLEKISGQILARLPRAGDLVADIADLERDTQDFIYHWTEVIALSNEELAAHFIAKAPLAFRFLEEAAVEGWIIKAMDAFDNRGLGFAIEIFDDLQGYVDAHQQHQTGCRFDQVAGLLRYLVRGLGGRALQLACEPMAYTDTERICLPPTLGAFPERDENARLYKCTAAFLWAQNRYGTWRYRVLEQAIRQLDAATTWPIYQRLETVRLTACISRDLPGLAREMATIAHADEAARESWERFTAQAFDLCAIDAGAEHCLQRVVDFIGKPLPPPLQYQGEMLPAKVREVLFKRVPREKAALQQALASLQQELGNEQSQDPESGPTGDAANRFSISTTESPGGAADFESLEFNDRAVPTGPELEALLASILQDLGEVEDDYLNAGTLGDSYPASAELGQGPGMELGEFDHGSRVELYPEWDYTRQRFREAFCALTEQDVPFGNEDFVVQTRAKYQGLSKSIQRVFEAILSEAQRQKKQAHGDELDLDALVEAHVDRLQGREMSDRLYTHFRKSGRSVAVMFMVDMSGSTKGWVNEAERESLVLLCEAVATLGDQYAIYGFSGRTNKRCEVYRIKTFDEGYSSNVRRRISGMAPKAYTRMGVAIRHLGKLLSAVPARTKLLITLSDGKPEDYGSYRGRYGIEDTRHALLEVKRSGIHPFCITIDKEAQSYLPHMYGASNFTVVDEVHKLPYKIADIYRRLTT